MIIVVKEFESNKRKCIGFENIFQKINPFETNKRKCIGFRMLIDNLILFSN